MPDKEERKAQAAQHNSLMVSAFKSETETSIAAAIIYEEGEGRELPLPEPSFDATEIIVTTSFAPEALFRNARGKTAVVDPASFTRPGGSYEDGAFGPEQILCSQSNLYQILCGIRRSYHDRNRDYRRGGLFTDRSVYLPDVAFSKSGTVLKADVIVIAEPLRERALDNRRSERECDREAERRIETLLRIAAANQCETLVCNAFACGRLGYDSSQVISLFKAWIDEHPGAIGRIVFSVPRAHLDAFNAAFGAPVIEKPAPAKSAEGDEEAESWRNVDLPEGVTIR